MGNLIDTVEVRALLPIHLDIHEQLVHDSGCCRIFERFVRHHVAPVTGRVADREEDWFVLAPRKLERVGAPRMPLDRICRVLQQVRTRLRGKAIASEMKSQRPCVRAAQKLECTDYSDEQHVPHLTTPSPAAAARRRSSICPQVTSGFSRTRSTSTRRPLTAFARGFAVPGDVRSRQVPRLRLCEPAFAHLRAHPVARPRASSGCVADRAPIADGAHLASRAVRSAVLPVGLR